ASLFAAGCGDADRPGDESGEAGTTGGNVSQATHDATGTGDPVHEDDEAEATGVSPAQGDATTPSGVGDNSEAVGSGVEAAGGGATGVRDAGAGNTGSGSAEGGAAGGEGGPGTGTDPGDS
ncbi:MAG TPA: hypothetical protein VF170_15915, partial [Planctomycetaceae bacterium]